MEWTPVHAKIDRLLRDGKDDEAREVAAEFHREKQRDHAREVKLETRAGDPYSAEIESHARLYANRLTEIQSRVPGTVEFSAYQARDNLAARIHENRGELKPPPPEPVRVAVDVWAGEDVGVIRIASDGQHWSVVKDVSEIVTGAVPDGFVPGSSPRSSKDGSRMVEADTVEFVVRAVQRKERGRGGSLTPNEETVRLAAQVARGNGVQGKTGVVAFVGNGSEEPTAVTAAAWPAELARRNAPPTTAPRRFLRKARR